MSAQAIKYNGTFSAVVYIACSITIIIEKTTTNVSRCFYNEEHHCLLYTTEFTPLFAKNGYSYNAVALSKIEDGTVTAYHVSFAREKGLTEGEVCRQLEMFQTPRYVMLLTVLRRWSRCSS